MRDRNCLAAWIMTSSSTAQICSAIHRKLTSAILNKSTFIPARSNTNCNQLNSKLWIAKKRWIESRSRKMRERKSIGGEVLDMFFQSSIGCPVMS
jgi:hypothetical protein